MISGSTRIYVSGPWTPFGGPETSFSGRIKKNRSNAITLFWVFDRLGTPC
jgi:hypothetical protein